MLLVGFPVAEKQSDLGMIGSVFESLVVGLNFSHIGDVSIVDEIALRRKASMCRNVGNGMLSPFWHSLRLVVLWSDYTIVKSDTVITKAFGEGWELQDVWVFEDATAVGAS